MIVDIFRESDFRFDNQEMYCAYFDFRSFYTRVLINLGLIDDIAFVVANGPVIIALSEAAKAKGLSRGQFIDAALNSGVVVVNNNDTTMRVFWAESDRIYQTIIERFWSEIENLNIIYLKRGAVDDIWYYGRGKLDDLVLNEDNLALKINRTILEMGYPNALALSYNYRLAHCGIEFSKENDKPIIFDWDYMKKYFFQKPTDTIVGIADKNRSKLAQVGVFTVGDLVYIDDPRRLQVIGSNYGITMFEELHGRQPIFIPENLPQVLSVANKYSQMRRVIYAPKHQLPLFDT